MNLVLNKNLKVTLLTLLGLICTAVMIFPLYWVFITSLKDTTEIFSTPPTLFPRSIDWRPYTENFLNNSDMWNYMGNSFQIAAGTTALTLFLAAPMAYCLTRLQVVGRLFFLLMLLIVQMFPSIMLALPLFVMFSKWHLTNSALAVILAITTKTLPFATLTLRPSFLSLPRELEDAAAIDGCGLWGGFYRIILPLTRPGLLTVGALTFLMAWSDFLFPLVLITDDTKRPLTLGIYKFIGQYGVRWNDLMAVAVVAALPIIFVFIFAQRYITSGLAVGSVKE
ncbi:MAG TPA: carbohydrate ABC transporter permease [Chloroflexia bacterium]|nr:carbohydrate ABC transporter permease [Chloroflexia bacterium]